MNRMDIKIRIGESVFRRTFSGGVIIVYWIINNWYWRGRLSTYKIITYFCNLFK